jgi:hypothetical protein
VRISSENAAASRDANRHRCLVRLERKRDDSDGKVYMRIHSSAVAALTLVGVICFFVRVSLAAQRQTLNSNQAASSPRDTPMKNHATGSFEVKLTPAVEVDKTEGSTIGRMTIDKKFSGDLDATSKGEMLSAITAVKGSAGYVAIERVTGTLKGRAGSFVLQHTGTMTRGEPQLSVTVVPDSGTGELTGLAGSLTITITNGKHFYDFEYTLPETH